MIKFLALRLAGLIGLLLLLTVVLFILQGLTPGDPAQASLGQNASEAAIAAERARLGLDQPLPVQYLNYLRGLVTGDLGESFRTHRPVSTDLADALPATAELLAWASLLAAILAILFAVSSILRWPAAWFFRSLPQIGSAAPTFLLAIGGVIIFYQTLDWLPASGRGADAILEPITGLRVLDGLLDGQPAAAADALYHLVLPSLALAISPALAIGRVLRSSLTATMDADFVRTARSKGLSEADVVRLHVMRNSIAPALSMAGLQVGFMAAGAVIIESIFSWPGLGSYLAASIPVSDFPAIAGVTLILGALYITVNTIVDIAQGVADPRINA